MQEAKFNVTYNMNGGVTWDEVPGMRKKVFERLLKRLLKQKKDENEAYKKASQGPTGGNRFLGR